jgi:Uma2 family endonuclease
MTSVAGYTRAVRAIFLDVPDGFLAERRRLGQDRKDEVWEGVVHMVPPPSGAHEKLVFALFFALNPIAERAGLILRGASTGLFDPSAGETNYRIPDVVLARPDQLSDRGLEGGELVVEVLSPSDESRDKFPFYARLGIRELWLVHPITRAFELHVLTGSVYIRRLPDAGGVVTSPVLGVTLQVASAKLRISDGSTSIDV